VKELVEKIDDYVQNSNRHAQPFVWTATADSIFAKVERLCERNYALGARKKVQQGFIEQGRVLQKGEMANIWQNQFSCYGNEPRHTICILALDEFIAVAIHDPSGHLDAAQLLVREVRLAVPHRLHLFQERFVFPGSRGELLIFLFTSA